MTILDSPRARWILTFAIATIALLFATLNGSNASADEVAQTSRASTVKIANFAYKPGKLTVAAGTKLTFSNSDSAPHTATAGGFDTGRISGGSSKSVKLSRKGTFSYHCTIHPSMRGKVVVK